MKNEYLFGFDVRNMIMFSFLAILPNLLGMLHYTTIFGLRVHFFQYAIFLAAILYGPIGGMVSGAVGSVYVAMALGNPYIVVGNVILGFVFGLFVRLKWNLVISVLAAYAIQLVWLIPSDIYLAHMPVNVVWMVVFSLLISNVIFVSLAGMTAEKIKHLLL